MQYRFISQLGQPYLKIIPEDEIDRVLLGLLAESKIFLSGSSECVGLGIESLTVGFIPQLPPSEDDGTRMAEPPPPAPTPAAPDPGPGWRLKKRGEMITDGDQIYWGCFGCDPWEPCGLREEVKNAQIRTPVYHNPANLETAGDGYRFCLVSETRQDATHCMAIGQSAWRELDEFPEKKLSASVTYRTKKPLPTT